MRLEVLILVLVEVAPRGFNEDCPIKKGKVLILVLVEVAPREKAQEIFNQNENES
ncbi:MAG: hypothetical protein PWQ53_732 [Bacteroidota bacterium]|nr:hypothetical protein [Bacteroidota bacterium]